MKAVWQAVSTVFVACLLAILSSAVLAQDGGNNLIAAEAFFDDPALAPGSGTPLPFSGASDAAFNEALGSVDLTGLDAGSHTVYVRFQDAYGDWSAPLGQSFYIPEGSLGDGNSVGGANRIQTAEAFFDADPGPGAGFPIAVPVDGAIDASFEVLRGAVDLSGVTPGQHTLYVRFKDAAGVWSAPLGQSVYITPELIGSAGGENRIVAAEYQIDGGAFQPAPVEDGVLGGLVEVVGLVETVSSDFHTARVRFQNSAGHWSQHTSSPPPPPPSPDDLDSDGLPDAWEQEWFGGLGQSGSDDPDGDGLTNLEENQQGSDPLTPDNLASPTISGFVLDTGGERLSGITVCIAGVVAHCDAGTDAFGHYVLGAATALADGDYTVTPQSASWVFTPSSQDVTISGASASGIDFTAEPPPPVPPPVAAIDSVAPETPTVGELVEFIGSAGPDGQVIDLYHWSAAELVNGLPLADRLEIGSTPSFVTDILRAGEWRIYLQVRNTDKLWSEAATLDITVLDDLGLSDLAVNPSSIRFLDQNGNQVFNPDQGDEVTVQVEVQNLGEVDTPDEVTLSLYDGSAEDGVLIGETAVPAIPAGGAVTLEAPWVVGFDIDGVPIPDYQDDYKIITIEAEFTGNLTQVQGMTSVAKTAELVAMARAGTELLEKTDQNNRATSTVRVGQPPPGSYGIDLTVNSTQSPYAGGTVTLFGKANYQWGQRLAVMGAQVTVRLDGKVVETTLTTAPNGIYVAKIQLPDEPRQYEATVTVFDENLFASASTTLNVTLAPTAEEWDQENGGSAGGGGGGGGGFPPPPAPAPTRDLKILSIGLTGDGLHRLESGGYAVVLGSALEVTARIVNAGNLPVENDFDVSFYAGDPDAGGTLLATETVLSGLPEGGSVTVTSPVLWSLDELGGQSIYVRVDEANAVAERDEYNNERWRFVTVKEYLPDLRPFDVSGRTGLYVADTPVVGEPVTLYVDVYNNGPADLSGADFEVTFYLGNPATNGQEIGRTIVSQASLVKGAKLTASIEWTPTAAGKVTLYAVVDTGGDPLEGNVPEFVEKNNQTGNSFRITPKESSLWPVELEFSNHAPRPNTAITISAIVENRGVEDAEDEVVEFYLGDPDAGGNLIGTAAIDILYGQSSRSDIAVDWITPATDGTYRIYARVQGNKYSRKLTVSANPPPDLVVLSADIGITPANPELGDEVEVSLSIKNVSKETAATDFTVIVSVDTPAGSQQLGAAETIDLLDPNSTLIMPVTEKIQIDQPYYVVLVDVLANPAQGDADYRNNSATRSFGVGEEAIDVELISVEPAKTVYGPGNTVVLKWFTSGLAESEDMVLSMKTLSAGDSPPAINDEWHQFTTTASNRINENEPPYRISEELVIPPGLATADDWTFCAGHEASGKFHCSEEFTYRDIEVVVTAVTPPKREDATYRPFDEITIEWEAIGADVDDPMILSMKRGDAETRALKEPDNINWYRFTSHEPFACSDPDNPGPGNCTTSNDEVDQQGKVIGQEKVMIPRDLMSEDDWDFCVRHVESDRWDCSGGSFKFENKNIRLIAPDTAAVYRHGQEVTLEWESVGMEDTDQIVLSMKQDSAAGLPAPDGMKWHLFTENTPNDGSEQVTFPAGLVEANDWRFFVRHITSNLFDASDQTFTYEDPVQDTTPPIITLLGANPQTLTVGDTYTELGATATDDPGAVDISDQIQINATGVDTSSEGDYLVTYNVTNAAGNAAEEVMRTIIVIPQPKPDEIDLGVSIQKIGVRGYDEYGVEKYLGPSAEPAVGRFVDYKITVTNYTVAAEAQNVTVIIEFPAKEFVDFIEDPSDSINTNWDGVARTLEWKIEEVTNGTPQTLVLKTQILSETPLVSTVGFSVSVDSNTAIDPNGENDSDSIGLVVIRDFDEDALPDRWEAFGYPENVDESARVIQPNEARVGQKDLFLWVDHMYRSPKCGWIGFSVIGAPLFYKVCTDGINYSPPLSMIGSADEIDGCFQKPNPSERFECFDGLDESLLLAFARRGIRLHVDYGEQGEETEKTRHRVRYEESIAINDVLEGLPDFKTDRTHDRSLVFTDNLARVYRYALLVNEYDKGTIKGVSTIPPYSREQGISISQYLDEGLFHRRIPRTDTERRATLFHELGHSLGLGHGGPWTLAEYEGIPLGQRCDKGETVYECIDVLRRENPGGSLSILSNLFFGYKPNYISSMNYLYLHYDGMGVPVKNDNVNIDSILDYSILALNPLNEFSLLERDGIGWSNPSPPLCAGCNILKEGLKVDDYIVLFYPEEENRCLPREETRLNDRINWNKDSSEDDEHPAARVNINCPAGHDLATLTTDTDWDHLVFGAWRIGLEPGEPDRPVYEYDDEGIIILNDEKSITRPFPPYRVLVIPYSEGVFWTLGPPGQTVTFAAVIFNAGTETDTYDVSITTTQGWTIEAEAELTVKSGHRRIFQFTVTIPSGVSLGTEEEIELLVRSRNRRNIIEAQSFFIRTSEDVPSDSDQDGIVDEMEFEFGLDPYDADTDGDAIVDGVELANFEAPEDRDNDGIIDALDPDNLTPVDSDDDGLGDDQELELGLDPYNPDTDNDGINDGLEVGAARVDDPPIDYDEDGIIDALEPGNTAYEKNSTATSSNPADFAVVGDQLVVIGNGAAISAGTGDASVGSNGSLRLGTNARVMDGGYVQSMLDTNLGTGGYVTGTITANGDVTLQTNARVDGSVYASGDARLRNGAKVFDELIAHGSISKGTNAVTGTEVEYAPLGTYFTAPLIAMPTCTVTAPGGQSFSTGVNTGPHLLPEGDYGNVKFGNGNQVILEGGLYSFQSLHFGVSSKIDVNGPSTLHVKNTLRFGNGAKQTLASGVAPEDIIYLLGSAASADGDEVTTEADDAFGVNAQLYGTFCGPGAAIRIRNGASLEGALYGRTISLGVNVKIISSPADLSTLP